VRILVIHAWFTGNLGDVLQTSVLVRYLRTLDPERLDIAGFPASVAPACESVIEQVDQVLEEESFPGGVRRFGLRFGRRAWVRNFRQRRETLFRRYDAIVSAPGPFLADNDPRHETALLDLEVAHSLGRPFVFSSHSIGPLSPRSLRRLSQADAIVARELETVDFLVRAGIQHQPAADYAFLHPLESGGYEAECRMRLGDGYRLVFLRFNNELKSVQLRSNGALELGEQVLCPVGDEPLVLGTSDACRDEAALSELASRLSVPLVVCRRPQELFGVIAGASLVATNRYHPGVCAALLGKQLTLLGNRTRPKRVGLERLLRTCSIEQLKQHAQAGLAEVQRALVR